MKRIIKSWLTPLLIAVAVFLIVRPALAQTISTPIPESVGAEVINGYQQVFYIYQGNKHFVTNESRNSRNPSANGGYITYVSDFNEAGQIFLYGVVNDTRTQLTFTGTNLNPKVDDKGRVTWEGWDGNTWQIFFFDGKSVRQLTIEETSLNPDLSGDYISYGRRGANGTWRAVVYSIKDDKSIDVALGENARNPKIRNGDIYLGVGSLEEEKFPLSVSDLFLLNLTPLTATDSTSLTASSSGNPILDELSATASGVVEVPIATESGITN